MSFFNNSQNWNILYWCRRNALEFACQIIHVKIQIQIFKFWNSLCFISRNNVISSKHFTWLQFCICANHIRAIINVCKYFLYEFYPIQSRSLNSTSPFFNRCDNSVDLAKYLQSAWGQNSCFWLMTRRHNAYKNDRVTGTG